MANKRKTYAFVFCVIGVSFYNIELFLSLNESTVLHFSIVGLSFSFAGLAFYISGIKNRVEKKIRMCPKCFFKNENSNIVCIKCRSPLI
jgi:uncharacterized paraquat-inducible protein A